MLEECRASVQAQTYDTFEHLTLVDHDREGCSVMVNRMVEKAAGDWLFLIADDDLLLPRCIEAHVNASDNADIVYGPPLVWGLHDPWWFFQTPPAIPSTALIRRDVWDALGGYDEDATREEDRKLWVRALSKGYRFVRISDQPTWVYRIHGDNKSFTV